MDTPFFTCAITRELCLRSLMLMPTGTWQGGGPGGNRHQAPGRQQARFLPIVMAALGLLCATLSWRQPASLPQQVTALPSYPHSTGSLWVRSLPSHWPSICLQEAPLSPASPARTSGSRS